MTIEEIRANAPEGATHYDRSGYYLKFSDQGWKAWSVTGHFWTDDYFILSEEQMELYGIKPL